MEYKIGQIVEGDAGKFRFKGGLQTEKSNWEPFTGEYKVGDIVEGDDGFFRFKGGIRTEKSNWEPVVDSIDVSPSKPTPPPETSFRTKVIEGIKNIPENILSIPEKVGELEIPSRFTNTGRFLTDAYFPRTRKRQTLKEKGVGNILAPVLDIATIPGRSFASLGDILGGTDKVQESMQDIKGTTLPGQILRSPMTPAAIASAIPTGGASFLPQLGGATLKTLPAAIAASRLGSIGAQAAAGATANQLENITENKDVNAKQASADFGFGVLGGLGGEGAAKVISAGVSKATSKITPGRIKSAVNKIYDEIKPSEAASQSGVTKDVLQKHEIIGDLKDARIKSEKIIKKNSELRDQSIQSTEHIAKKIMGPDYKPTININKLVDDISFSDDMTPGFQEEQYKALKDIIRRTEEINPDGNISLSDIPKVKHIIAKIRNFNKSPASQSYDDVDKILGIAYKKLDDEFIDKVGKDVSVYTSKNTDIPQEFLTKLQSNADAVKLANTNMSELIPVKDAIENKISKGYYDKRPGLFKRALKSGTSMGNLGLELLLLNKVGGGVPTLTRLGLFTKDELSPSIAKTLIKSRDAKAMGKVIEKYGKDPDFMNKIKDPTSEEFKSLPSYMQQNISSRIGTLPAGAYTGFGRMSPLQREERNNLMNIRKAMQNQPNKLQTFGSIAGLGSGNPTDYQNKPKKKKAGATRSY